MRSCPVLSSSRDGNIACRKQMLKPVSFPRQALSGNGQRSSQICFQHPLGNGDWRVPQAQLVILRRRSLRAFLNSPRSDWIREGITELRLRISSDCNAYKDKGRGCCKAFKGAIYDYCRGDGQDGSGNGRGCSNGGSGWPWGNGWGNGRDGLFQGQACLIFLLGYLVKHACDNIEASTEKLEPDAVFEVRGGMNMARITGRNLFSVTGDYLNYTLWRMGQNIASQINGVLTTQALLYAVGLGKGAIPTAAALNWVLKDGIGYLSKILLANYGRHFDVHPKGWRLLADLLENASYALELLTPIYPHLFVYLGAAAGAGKSAAGLIQAATRSCFYAGFAAQRNFAEVIAKGEAQGMVSKFLGIALGIAISASVGASGPRLVVTFLMVTGIHMFCNLKSYQAVQLRTLNPYRACLIFGEYIRGGVVASVEEVNAAEPIFTEIPFLLLKQFKHKGNTGNVLSLETKEDAATIASKLKLGVSFRNVIRSQSEADRLFKIYRDEKYVLVERQNAYQALLKEGTTSRDLLKLMLQVCYLHQLRTGQDEGDFDFYVSSSVEISHRLAVEKFDLVQKQLSLAGWSILDGVVARPLPYRLLNVPV
ncbi:hypothetical protein GOP47_0022390 [Adiantum capillus-veneris]|uniref:Protein root UVB sensitive 1, chloroplastic n=1 Tax=Adiantum capillus-veneris TaxID=13818 RepID=A0A9D4U5A6_ADICA|nr:hypothetical protein GOP47_0022390 [Adiantum capillus-veneris]